MNEREESTPAGKFRILRTWPAVLLLFLMACLKSLPLFFTDESMAVLFASIMGPLLAGVLLLLWWVTFSRASVGEKVFGFAGIVVTIVAVWFLSDHTMHGPGVILIGAPLGMAAFGLVTVFLGRTLSSKRTMIAFLAATAGFSVVTLLRNDGMWGDGQLGLNWRWSESPEEVMLAERVKNSAETASRFSADEMSQWIADPQWPQFRGPDGDSVQSGAVFDSKWDTTPPKLEWKISIGPGWSSFVVAGNLLFTQQQLGEMETVVCYAADTGEEVWTYKIKERFFDPLGGPGPRATPTLANGMLFAQSAMGELHRLDPMNGTLVWSKDIKSVADRLPPTWGFSSSPLVVGDQVIVHAGGENESGVLAFNVESGDLAWKAKAGGHSYSSPCLGNINGKECVLMLSDYGLNVIDPLTGAQLLDYQWKHSGYRATQPQVIGDASILLPTQELGTRKIELSTNPDSDSMKATEIWTSRHLKPDFNDFVIFENHAYGFDGRFFACINLKTGKRAWRGGRYGKGQVLLLQDSAMLLVVSESGDIILLEATPDSRNELCHFKALEGRTWNHPVVIGDRLYIRNSQEAACYVLPTNNEQAN